MLPRWGEFREAHFRIAVCSLACFLLQKPIKTVLPGIISALWVFWVLARCTLNQEAVSEKFQVRHFRYINSAHFRRSLLELMASLPMGQIQCCKFRWDYFLTGAEMLKTAKCVYILIRVHETSDGSSPSNSLIGIMHRFWILWIIFALVLEISASCRGTVALPV